MSILVHRAMVQVVLFSDVTLSVPYINSSSKTNGIAIARENGHPTIAPAAKARVAKSVLRIFVLFVGSITKAYATVFAYMAKEDGRNAIGLVAFSS